MAGVEKAQSARTEVKEPGKIKSNEPSKAKSADKAAGVVAASFKSTPRRSWFNTSMLIQISGNFLRVA